jgi:hypothetical protein
VPTLSAWWGGGWVVRGAFRGASRSSKRKETAWAKKGKQKGPHQYSSSALYLGAAALTYLIIWGLVKHVHVDVLVGLLGLVCLLSQRLFGK